MVVRRERKIRRQRGSRLYGWGQVGQHRKSGARGGFGKAGLHKHKWSWVVKYDSDQFGKEGFVRPTAVTHEVKVINVGALASLIHGKDLQKDDKGRFILDLYTLGYEKVLGSGKIGSSIVVKAPHITELAKKKISDAGGEVVQVE
jgi:large subunit ribosomal protein L15